MGDPSPAIAKRLEVWTKELPVHPAVDWTTLNKTRGWMAVEITCRHCGGKRSANAATVKSRIKGGTFTGLCYQDRLIHKERSDRSVELKEHPQVDWNDKIIANGKRCRVTKVAVVCPKCKQKRYMAQTPTARSVSGRNFTGICLACCGNARKREWIKLAPGRIMDPSRGYVHITLSAIQSADVWLFRLMQKSGGIVEHRFVMAKSLGRPLLPNELVDHMDGVKTNNTIENLRLYRKGKNEPGETNGYGTYYHEWQMALARIRELECQLTY